MIRYQGQPLLAEGEQIRPGRPVLELHLDNARVAEIGRSGGNLIWRIRRELRRDLAELARSLPTLYPDVDGVIGTGLLSAGAAGMGLHTVPMAPGPGRWWLKVYMSWLDRVYRFTPLSDRQKVSSREVATIWLSTAELRRLEFAGKARQNP